MGRDDRENSRHPEGGSQRIMECMVCKNKLADGVKKCGICGFNNELPHFLSETQYRQWIENEVAPCRDRWQAEQQKKKKEEKQKAEQKKRRHAYLERVKKDSTFAGAIGVDFSVFIKSDGRLEFYGANQEVRAAVEKWENIVAVAAGDFHLLGLHSDGRVSAGKNNLNQCDTELWKDIVQITACGDRSAGVDSKGNVHICGDTEFDIRKAQEWKLIRKISLGYSHILGLTEYGTVKAAGSNEDSQCRGASEWKNIIDIAAGEYHSLAVGADGKVYAAGSGLDGECSVDEWRDIGAVTASTGSSAGIGNDGTVWLAGRVRDVIKERKASGLILGVNKDDYAIVTEQAEIVGSISQKRMPESSVQD